jgi:hypothetical protein
MPNHMKFCGCRRCRSGMHTKSGGDVVRKAVRKARRSAKQKLKQRKEPDPRTSVEYTD